MLLAVAFLGKISLAQTTHHYNPFADVLHYDFEISVNDTDNVVNGTATITFILLKQTESVFFDLVTKREGVSGMQVYKVSENGGAKQFKHINDQLKIFINSTDKPGDTVAVKIIYSGLPANGLVFGKNKFGRRTIFGDNWPNRARYWLPCVDHLSDKATVDFKVTAPEHYKVISNGILIEESAIDGERKFTHWKENIAIPTKVMVIGLADFAVNYTGDYNCTPISSWVFPPDRKAGFYDYDQALEILPFFANHIAPYAFEKLANVEAITIFGGMENASAIFYNELSITGKRSSSEELMAHEIAHQWFGNSATEADWPHLWLSEGFATYMTNLYLENKYGEDTLNKRLAKDRKTVIAFSQKQFTPVVDTTESADLTRLLNANSYQKGGWVLHMLRRKLGDDIFWKGIRSYYQLYAGSNATTNDFRDVMENVSGTDLKEFFQQWLYTPGQPQLDITWQYNDSKKTLMLKILQQQQASFLFPLTFSIKYGSPVKTLTQQFEIKNKLTEIQLSLAGKPFSIIADPDTNLLAAIKLHEQVVSF